MARGDVGVTHHTQGERGVRWVRGRRGVSARLNLHFLPIIRLAPQLDAGVGPLIEERPLVLPHHARIMLGGGAVGACACPGCGCEVPLESVVVCQVASAARAVPAGGDGHVAASTGGDSSSGIDLQRREPITSKRVWRRGRAGRRRAWGRWAKLEAGGRAYSSSWRASQP